jgi:hypothetical protein
MNVRVDTTLNQGAGDESFAIADVQVTQESLMRTNFEAGEMDGWDCGAITSCGDYGSICGGFGQKGSGATISKTFNVQPGNYDVALDFIKVRLGGSRVHSPRPSLSASPLSAVARSTRGTAKRRG